jgi:hypothetical protein
MNEPILTPKSLTYKIKELVIKTSLFAFGVTFELVSKHSPELKQEISDWEEGRTFSLGLWNNDLAMSVQKKGDRVFFLGLAHVNPKLTIYFRNVDAALLVFMGQIGSHMAFIEHRGYLHGNLGEAMQTARAMNIVQKYLFPVLILNKTFKEPPTFTFSQLMLKARVYATLVPAMILNLGKLF